MLCALLEFITLSPVFQAEPFWNQTSEDRQLAVRLEREKREKQLRKEAYLQAEEENEKARALQEAELLQSLVGHKLASTWSIIARSSHALQASDTTKNPEDIIREQKEKQKHRRHHAGTIEIKLEPEIDMTDVVVGKSQELDDFDAWDGLYAEKEYTTVEDTYLEG